MRRRRWRPIASAALLLSALPAACNGPPAGAASAHTSAAASNRTVALTIDDLPTVSTSTDSARQREITDGILAALRAEGAPAVGFVNESKLYEGDRLDSTRVALLREWLEAGLELGNHTWSHRDLHGTSLEEFQREVLLGERVTRELMRVRGGALRWFRHPFLHTGTSLDVKHGFESFLADRGYRVAPVTIDNSDYVFARAYDRALDAGGSAEADSIARTYLTYMDTVAGFYEAQSRAILGYELPQILLLHANRLNAHHLDDLLALLRRRGYAFITLEQALSDSAYDRRDEYTGPGGITWLHRWALTEGVPGSVFAGEPEPAAWIAERAR